MDNQQFKDFVHQNGKSCGGITALLMEAQKTKKTKKTRKKRKLGFTTNKNFDIIKLQTNNTKENTMSKTKTPIYRVENDSTYFVVKPSESQLEVIRGSRKESNFTTKTFVVTKDDVKGGRTIPEEVKMRAFRTLKAKVDKGWKVIKGDIAELEVLKQSKRKSKSPAQQLASIMKAELKEAAIEKRIKSANAKLLKAQKAKADLIAKLNPETAMEKFIEENGEISPELRAEATSLVNAKKAKKVKKEKKTKK